MAKYEEIFTSKMDWAKPFQRTGKFPLDRSDLFGSYDDAVKYAAGNKEDPDSRGLCGTSYIGQVITVFEDDVVTCYVIDAARKLQKVGSVDVAGDDKSIVLVDGVFKLKGFAEAIAAGSYAGKTPRISATGELEWVAPDTTTVDGINQTIAGLQSDFRTLSDKVDGFESDLDSKVDKVEGKGLSTNDYTTEEKQKLAGIAANAEVNVQADWDEEDTTSDAYILNKPTALSEFTNDSNFIDNTVSNLVNYYTKSESYTKDEVNDLLGAIHQMKFEVVSELPTSEISATTIYLVPKGTTAKTKNTYNEYIYITSASEWELIGDTAVDLTNYLQKDGDASDVTVAFTEASERALPATGEALDVILGKVIKYLADLKTVAFTGEYSDLANKPAILQYSEFTLAVGNTAHTYTAASNDVVSVLLKDAVTHEVLLADVKIQDNQVTVSLAQAYENDITVRIAYNLSQS